MAKPTSDLISRIKVMSNGLPKDKKLMLTTYARFCYEAQAVKPNWSEIEEKIRIHSSKAVAVKSGNEVSVFLFTKFHQELKGTPFLRQQF
jgi:hypothetical protein